MSFGLPSVKTKPDLPANADFEVGNFGIPDLMTHGITSAKSNLEYTHPVQASEKRYRQSRDHMNMRLLRNTQGLHAPLRIKMELQAAKRVVHLPFLPSSNVTHDVLTGRDLEIGPEDIFNTTEFRELAGQPHAVFEHSLGIL